MKTRAHQTLILCGLMAASACGMMPTKEKGKKAAETDLGLAGEWQNDCEKKDWLGVTHQREVHKYSATGDFERATKVFSDNECNAAIADLVEGGTFSSLGKSKDVANATDINYTITSATVTPKTENAVKIFNTASYCGKTDWAINASKDVLGLKCLDKTHAKGEVIFDIYRVDMDGKRLTTGKPSLFLSKEDAASRPAALNEQNTFAKK